MVLNPLPQIIIDYGDSIPIIAYWTDDYTGTPVAITLVGATGAPLNDSANQLCYFSLIDEETNQPVTVGSTTYQYVSLLLDATATQAYYTIQDNVPVGRYIVVAEYDSTNTTNNAIVPLRKKAFGEVIVNVNPLGDIDPQ